MKIAFACPYCGKKLFASDTSAGKEKTCPNCRARVTVPTAEAAAEKAKKGAPKRREAADHPVLMMGRRPEHQDLIDMTAMVDIVFFLLIFFLVTSMASVEAVINIPPPQASSDTVQAVKDFSNDQNFVVITVDADDIVEVDGELTPSEQDLRTKLRAAHEEGKDGIMINVAADSSHGKFVMILDAGADAGMTQILFSAPHSDESTGG
jgi:biopolymer transport protein ExbD